MENKLKCQIIEIQSEIYLVSDREIKEECLYYHTITKTIEKAIHCQGKSTHPYPRVEATTDKSLGLPLIPESFIKEWVERQGKIEHTYIKTLIDKAAFPDGARLTRRSDPNDIHSSEVIILPTKDTFTREEIVEIVRPYYKLVRDSIRDNKPHPYFSEWFKKNY